MSNIIDYVSFAFDTFSHRPFCDVDSLVLSQFSYIHFPLELFRRHTGLTIRDFLRAEDLDGMLRKVRAPEENCRLLFALAASPRFRDIGVDHFVEYVDVEAEAQFSALTFRLDSHTTYVAFRGTDLTFVGWKEDFNMAFQSTIPSQRSALDYLELMATAYPGNLIAGGHSKGGNLAMYAAALCSPAVQARITQVYSHDGPGFRAETFALPGFRAIESRVRRTVPQSSIIGMLLEGYKDYHIVRSTSHSIRQHDPFTWVVDGDDFAYAPKLSASAQYANHSLSDWLAQLSDEERELLVNTAYHQVNREDYADFAEFRQNWQENLLGILSSLHTTDPNARSAVGRMMKGLVVQLMPKVKPGGGESDEG